MINELEKEIGCPKYDLHNGHELNCFMPLIQGTEIFKNRFINSKDGSCPHCATFPTNSENTFEVFHLSSKTAKANSIQELLLKELQEPSEKFTLICSGCSYGKPQDIQSFRSIIKEIFLK